MLRIRYLHLGDRSKVRDIGEWVSLFARVRGHEDTFVIAVKRVSPFPGLFLPVSGNLEPPFSVSAVDLERDGLQAVIENGVEGDPFYGHTQQGWKVLSLNDHRIVWGGDRRDEPDMRQGGCASGRFGGTRPGKTAGKNDP